MKVSEIIEYVDKVKPNTFDNECKLMWMNEVYDKISIRLFSHGSNKDHFLSLESDIDIPKAYIGIYYFYLMAMMEYLSGEFEKYTQSSYLYNEAVSEYAKYIIRNGLDEQNEKYKANKIQ